MEISKERPIAKVKDGAFEVAVWKNKINNIESYSLKLTKNYQKNGKWQSDGLSIFHKDIARCIFLLGEGYREIISRKPKGPIQAEDGTK
jgi:hypothetical protein